MTHHPPSPLRVSKSVSCKLSSFMKKVGGGVGLAHTLDTSLPSVMNHYYYLINPFTLNE